MKKQPKPTKHSSVVLNQLCKLIPTGMVRGLAIEYGVDKKSRTFTPWSHVVCLLYCHLVHSIGLNDLCDALRHHSAKLFAVRGATPPSRNGLSNANKERNADMMEALFWKMLDHLQNQFPGFGPSGRYKGLPRRFKKTVYSIDSSTITLVANCMDWAASSVCDLYKSRWAIEVFFKQIKQTLQVCDFLGHSKQAIRWQLWSALLMYLLLRFHAWCSDWPHSFARIFTMIRAVVWDRFDLGETLAFYGTAGGRWRMRVQPQAAYLTGEDWSAYGTA